MNRAIRNLVLMATGWLVLSGTAAAQTITYHLHVETNGSGVALLKTAGPDAASTFVQSVDFKGITSVPYTSTLKTFVAQTAVAGTIPAGSTVTFTLWMKKTASWGTVYPTAYLFYQNADGFTRTPLCTATGSTALTTTLTQFTFSCTISSSYQLTGSNPYLLWVQATLTTGPGNKSVKAELDYEGTLNGNYDSRILVPQPLPPNISSLSPTSGPFGTPVTISGSRFGTTQGTNTLTFNGTAGTPTSWSDTSIAAPVPTGATTGPVVVTVNGAASNGVNFTVPAIVSGLSPTSGPVGTSVNITGSNFGSTQGTSTVTFNGTTSTPTSWSTTSIWAPVPPGATAGPVVVTVSGIASNGVTFAVSPAISGLSPTNGPVGTTVTISGTTFGATQGTSTVTFNGTAASPTSWSSTSIVVPVPSTATTGPVVVTVGGLASSGVTFSVVPSITSISPTSGGPGGYVTVTGTAFGASRGSSTVTFNGTTTNPSNWSNTSIVVPVPSNATTGPVAVTVGGFASNGVTFTFVSTGTISGQVSRSSDGSAISGATIKALQSGLVKATTTSAADGSYSMPGLTPGLYDISASAAGYTAVLQTGKLVTAASTTAVDILFGAPAIGSLTPASGPVGSSVTISGSNFGSTQGTSSVTFNGTPASPTAWNDTSLSVPVPAGASTGPVVVAVGGVVSNGVTFTVGTGSLGGTVSQASNGTPISGALVEALQSNAVKASITSAADGTYTINNLSPGTYDLRVSATGFGTAIQTAFAVTAGTTTTANVALSSPGTISGRVTKSDGITTITGASLTVLQGAITAGTATSDSTANYSVGNLSAGSYIVQATATGYTAQSQLGVSVTAGSTTTANFNLSGQSAITYVYDDQGRLIGVVDSLSDAATYSYDAVGNLLTISRYSSAQISVIGFTPKSGPVGTSVTINGTAFSPSASQNTVSFNGTAATITSATSTQIFTSVPAGATTGPIAVTSPAGSATSSGSFTVTSSSGAPTITGFTPTIGIAGTAVSVTGSNFDSSPVNDRLSFNVTFALVSSATSASLSTSVPSGGTSGRISLGTPTGNAVSSADFFVPPSPYQPSNVGFTGRMAMGSTATVTLNTPSQIGLMLFDGIAGQNVSLNLTNKTISNWTDVYIYNPNGSTFASLTITGSSGFIDTQTLPATGTYTILIHPQGTGTGSIDLTLSSVVDISGTISPGGTPVTVNISTPGQNASLPFVGTQGQRISLLLTKQTLTAWTDLYIYNPDGTTLASLAGGNAITGSSGFIDTQVLPATGTYRIFVSPEGPGTGSFTLTLYNVPPDVTGTITQGGPPVTMNIATPGQNGALSFSGTAGERISLNITNKTITSWTDFAILNPNGTTLASMTVTGSGGFIDTLTLGVTGTYTISVNPQGAGSGNVTLTLYDVPADATGSVTINGPATTITITTPGQNANVTFSGTAGQQATVHITGNAVGCMTVTLLKPAGTSLTSVSQCNGGFDLATQTLPVTGTYTININPWDAASGTLNVSVTSP